MNYEQNTWIQSIYKSPLLDGITLAKFVDNFKFSISRKCICVDLVEGAILNELLINDRYPYFKLDDFLQLLRKPVAVEWMDIYVSSTSPAISHEDSYEQILPQADLLIRAVDGGYIYTYIPCISGDSKIKISNFDVIEVIKASISELSFPG
ncbi:hypothetical protein HNP29_002056 [Pseudomonas alcaligenes]|nr:hypothetical protein [Pseudomonas alcaligenes]